MTEYSVWVSAGGDAPRVAILKTGEGSEASDLTTTLIKYGGLTTFSVGADDVHTEDATPPARTGGQTAAAKAATSPVRLSSNGRPLGQ